MAVILPDLPLTETVVIEMTNAFRVENKLAGVVPNTALRIAAQAYADYLARTGTFAHTADGRQPADRAQIAGYRYCIVAENLALNQSSRGFEARDLASRMVEGWKNSPPHRASMLQPLVTEIGVGIAQSPEPDPKFLTVQLFGRPATFKYEVHIENRSGTAVTYVLGDKNSSVPDQTHVKHTSCVPQELTFDIGKVTTKFEAGDGGTFIISRGTDGRLRVDRQQAATSASAAAPKKVSAVRAARPAVKPAAVTTPPSSP
jgi:Cysteine-rich secretory protein family